MIQFQFFAEAETWIESLCNRDAATVKVMGLKSDNLTDGYVTHFVDISSEKTNAEHMTKELENDSRVIESDLAKVGPNRLIGTITSRGCGVSVALVENNTNCFIAPAQASGDCRMSYKLFISDEGLPSLLQKLHQRGINYKISNVSPLTTKRKLTPRQERVVRSALELGYSEYPKRIATEQLFETLGISSSILTELLTRLNESIEQPINNGQKFPQLDTLAEECVFCRVMKEIERNGGLNEFDEKLLHRHLYREHLMRDREPKSFKFLSTS